MKCVLASLLLVVALLEGAGTGRAETLSDTSSSLRLGEPLDFIVADLESYIPGYMEKENIPGVGIALICDGELAWTSGFGVSNRIIQEPVSDKTLFEVASNSKVLTAYLALRLVDQGKLHLDQPLNAYLSEPWLPPSEHRDEITLRHVLSHTSGLGHNSPSRENLFAPGRGYSYSGMGFLYLQEVIEEVTGQSLEEVAQELLFEPLGMSSSSYVNEDEKLCSRTAFGHIWAAVPTFLFMVLYLTVLVCIALLGLPILRLRTGRWRPSDRILLGSCCVALVLALLPPFLLLRPLGLSEFAWLIAYCGLAFLGLFGLLILLGRAFVRRFLPHRKKLRAAGTATWSLLVVIGLGFVAGSVRNLPVPRATPVPPGAASSVRATARDMAKFLIELSAPRLLDRGTAEQMLAPQVQLAQDLSWGLGPGLQHSAEGDALWQWGQHIDFQSVMIIYPDHGFGVVVLTNSDLLNPDVAINIAHRAIGGKIDAILRGSHTEFDHREID